MELTTFGHVYYLIGYPIMVFTFGALGYWFLSSLEAARCMAWERKERQKAEHEAAKGFKYGMTGFLIMVLGFFIYIKFPYLIFKN